MRLLSALFVVVVSISAQASTWLNSVNIGGDAALDIYKSLQVEVTGLMPNSTYGVKKIGWIECTYSTFQGKEGASCRIDSPAQFKYQKGLVLELEDSSHLYFSLASRFANPARSLGGLVDCTVGEYETSDPHSSSGPVKTAKCTIRIE